MSVIGKYLTFNQQLDEWQSQRLGSSVVRPKPLALITHYLPGRIHTAVKKGLPREVLERMLKWKDLGYTDRLMYILSNGKVWGTYVFPDFQEVVERDGCQTCAKGFLWEMI